MCVLIYTRSKEPNIFRIIRISDIFEIAARWRGQEKIWLFRCCSFFFTYTHKTCERNSILKRDTDRNEKNSNSIFPPITSSTGDRQWQWGNRKHLYEISIIYYNYTNLNVVINVCCCGVFHFRWRRHVYFGLCCFTLLVNILLISFFLL